MKKLLALLLCLVMVLGLGTTAFAADAKSNDIVILHTDDVHCGVTDGMGYAGVAAYKAEMLKTHNYVALVDCGAKRNILRSLLERGCIVFGDKYLPVSDSYKDRVRQYVADRMLSQ